MRKVGLIVLVFLMTVCFASAQITAIYDIQYCENPGVDDVSPLEGETVTIEGWVTFEPISGEGNRWFVADAPGAWNGIYVYGDPGEMLGFGMQVQVTGEIQEYWGLTELYIGDEADPVTIIEEEVDWTTDLPEACEYTVVGMEEIAGGAETAEQYEAVLIKVENAICEELPGEFGEWLIIDESETFEVKVDNPMDPPYGYVHNPVVGMPYFWVRGPLMYSHDEYKILPEIAYDISVDYTQEGWYTPFAWMQQVRPYDMVARQDGNGDWYTNDHSYASLTRYGIEFDWRGAGGDDTTGVAQYAKLHALATAPTGLYYAGDGVKFIMTDFDNAEEYSTPWSSVLAYYGTPEQFPDVFIGDEVIFVGGVDEYTTGPANMTEHWIGAPAVVQSEGNTLPIPTTVSTAEIRDPMTAEQWGNVFVKVENSVVTDNELQYEMFRIDDNLDDDIDGIAVDDDSDSLDADEYPLPPFGTTISEITGWIYHHYGTLDPEANDWVYKLVPQGPSDIVYGEGPPNIMSVVRSPSTPGPGDDVTITASISDNSQVVSAILHWKVGVEGDWNDDALTYVEGITWEATIPGQDEGTYVWYYIEAEDDLEAVSTYPGDTENDMLGYTCLDELSIYDVQYTPYAAGNSPYDGVIVTLTGVITTTQPNALEYYDTHFMQMGDEHPYNGICVTIPPDVAVVNSGNLVSVTGTVTESDPDNPFRWGGNTKLMGVVSCEIEGYQQEWTTYSVTAAEVNADLESYESTFVEFTNLTITSINEYDCSFIDDSGETFLLDNDIMYEEDLLAWFDGLQVDDTIEYVRGIINYSYGSWKVEPRNVYDVSEVKVGEGEHVSMPIEFVLEPAFPNPFNPSTNISFSIPNQGHVHLTVFNALGQAVRNLVDAPMRAGTHYVYWNGLDNGSNPVASGTYFLRLRADGQSQVQKLVFMK